MRRTDYLFLALIAFAAALVSAPPPPPSGLFASTWADNRSERVSLSGIDPGLQP